MADLSFLTNIWIQHGEILEAVIMTMAFFGLAKLVNYLLKHQVVKLTAKTKTSLDDMLIKSLRMPITLGFVLAGLYIGILSISYLSSYAATITQIFSLVQIFFTAFVVARVVNALLDWYAKGAAAKTHTKIDDHMLPALKKAVYLVAFLVAILFLMRGMGVEITTLVATFGIGGLAIGLALQDTLSNFFAGAYTTIEKPIKVGDLIELETG
jgi:MscS family membrane protein